uniref:Uncharacterized protein n=1 Tax=Acrobeloides nanus TaxID=290746 RepID=A0A914CSQ9_9BILA
MSASTPPPTYEEAQFAQVIIPAAVNPNTSPARNVHFSTMLPNSMPYRESNSKEERPELENRPPPSRRSNRPPNECVPVVTIQNRPATGHAGQPRPVAQDQPRPMTTSNHHHHRPLTSYLPHMHMPHVNLNLPPIQQQFTNLIYVDPEQLQRGPIITLPGHSGSFVPVSEEQSCHLFDNICEVL